MNELDVSTGTLAEEEADCLHVMERLLSTLSDGTARLDVKRNSSGLIFLLIPANKNSANFGLHYDGCVDVFFGDSGTTFEVEFGHGSQNADFAAALAFTEKVGRAVIAGRCNERAGFLGVRGTVEVDGKPYRVTHFFHFRLFPKTVSYAPYAI
jgi:hypothetical protein